MLLTGGDGVQAPRAQAGHGGRAEAWAQGIGMARESLGEETTRLSNALFVGFHRLGASDELVFCMRLGFLVFSSLPSLIPLPYQIFAELAPSLILWTPAD